MNKAQNGELLKQKTEALNTCNTEKDELAAKVAEFDREQNAPSRALALEGAPVPQSVSEYKREIVKSHKDIRQLIKRDLLLEKSEICAKRNKYENLSSECKFTMPATRENITGFVSELKKKVEVKLLTLRDTYPRAEGQSNAQVDEEIMKEHEQIREMEKKEEILTNNEICAFKNDYKSLFTKCRITPAHNVKVEDVDHKIMIAMEKRQQTTTPSTTAATSDQDEAEGSTSDEASTGDARETTPASPSRLSWATARRVVGSRRRNSTSSSATPTQTAAGEATPAAPTTAATNA